jgi:polyphosphate glucokinase
MPEELGTVAAPSRGEMAIGIDFGASAVKGAAVDLRTGQFVCDRVRILTPQPSLPREVVKVMGAVVDRVMEQLTTCVEPALSAADAAALPVGVGIPSVTRGGVVLTAANIDSSWIGFPAEREMSLAMGRPVVVGNDADVAGLAEVRFGAGRGQRGTTIVLTIGTGMGTALFVNGRLLPNTELGHIEMKSRDAEERVAESARSRLNLNWKEWAAGFDEYLHVLERLFWPDLFILGGGGSKRSDNYMQYLTVKTPVVIATLKNNAGIAGGALLARDGAAASGE